MNIGCYRNRPSQISFVCSWPNEQALLSFELPCCAPRWDSNPRPFQSDFTQSQISLTLSLPRLTRVTPGRQCQSVDPIYYPEIALNSLLRSQALVGTRKLKLHTVPGHRFNGGRCLRGGPHHLCSLFGCHHPCRGLCPRP